MTFPLTLENMKIRVFRISARQILFGVTSVIRKKIIIHPFRDTSILIRSLEIAKMPKHGFKYYLPDGVGWVSSIENEVG